MAAFAIDLTAVWAERRMRADEASRRQAARLDVLYATRRGTPKEPTIEPIIAILSVMVELAVLLPLIALIKEKRSREAQDLYNAAARASEELKVARRVGNQTASAKNARDRSGRGS